MLRLEVKKMGRKRSTKKERARNGLDSGLEEANKTIIHRNRGETHNIKILVNQIIMKIIAAMKKQSSTFALLYVNTFGGGSSYEGLKVGEPREFDIDVLLKIPDVTNPILDVDTIPGFVQFQLRDFLKLKQSKPNLYSDMSKFVDGDNYLLTTEMKSTFMQSILDQTINNYFPNGVVRIGANSCTISKVQRSGPAFTLTIQGPTKFDVSIDLVPCILLTKEYWPQQGFKSNPYSKPSEFFLVPKEPKKSHPHLDRYWRLSLQMQERKIIHNRFWLKPAIRVLKCMRDHFGHDISSYAIKTVFMWELYQANPDLDQHTPDLFGRGSFGHCVVEMLERYLRRLEQRRIPYFWYSKLNLLDSLTDSQIDHYKADVDRMLEDIKKNPTSSTILSYLSSKN